MFNTATSNTPFRPILLVAVSLLVGAFAGWYVAASLYSKMALSFAAPSTLYSLEYSYRALQFLRSGNTNEAIEWFESRLDGEIIELNGLASAETDAKKRAAYVRALVRVRQYRGVYPRTTGSPEVDRVVTDALTSVDREKGK